ncbi:MAG: hypothetical protein RIR01_1999 [Bacteroidota bacterium]
MFGDLKFNKKSCFGIILVTNFGQLQILIHKLADA